MHLSVFDLMLVYPHLFLSNISFWVCESSVGAAFCLICDNGGAPDTWYLRLHVTAPYNLPLEIFLPCWRVCLSIKIWACVHSVFTQQMFVKHCQRLGNLLVLKGTEMDEA